LRSLCFCHSPPLLPPLSCSSPCRPCHLPPLLPLPLRPLAAAGSRASSACLLLPPPATPTTTTATRRPFRPFPSAHWPLSLSMGPRTSWAVAAGPLPPDGSIAEHRPHHRRHRRKRRKAFQRLAMTGRTDRLDCAERGRWQRVLRGQQVKGDLGTA
jgi:hypothetical protein